MPDVPDCPCSNAGPPRPLKGSFDDGVGAPVPIWPDDLWAGWLNPAPSNPDPPAPARSTARLAPRLLRAPLRQSDSVLAQCAPGQAVPGGTARCPSTSRTQAAGIAPGN